MNNSKGMIDISGKKVTQRTATSGGTVFVGAELFDIIRQGKCPKGNVLETAKIAAINAVKATPSIIPMCHPINIEAISADFTLREDEKSVCVKITVKSTGKTGVEMEAMSGVSAACLTIYDMLKYKGRDMVISEIKLLEKTGGKSGDFKRKD